MKFRKIFRKEMIFKKANRLLPIFLDNLLVLSFHVYDLVEKKSAPKTLTNAITGKVKK